MDPATGALIAGMIAGTGSVVGGSISSKKQYKYNKALMEQNQNWLTNMSNTAHQREVEDLMKAGLNPILSVMGGSGASTPSGSIGQVNAPDYGSSIAGGISTAMQVKRNNADVNLINQQAKTEEARRINFEADTGLKNLQAVYQQVMNSNAPEKIKLEMGEIVARTKLAYATSTANQITANANMIEAKTKEKWTPATVGAGIATGIGGTILGATLGKAKLPAKALKYINRVK